MKYGQCIISGYINGQKFRPSNWSERLCEAGAIFDPLKRVMRYSAHLYPRQCEEHGCSVYVDFNALDAELVSYISWFIGSNGLEMVSLLPKQAELQSELIAVPEHKGVVSVVPPLTPKRPRRKKAAAA